MSASPIILQTQHQKDNVKEQRIQKILQQAELSDLPDLPASPVVEIEIEIDLSSSIVDVEKIQSELKTRLIEKVKDVLMSSSSSSSSSSLFSQTTVILLVKYGMELMEATELKGSQRRDILLQILRSILVEEEIVSMSEEQKNFVRILFDSGILVNIVDTIVLASKGGIHINSLREGLMPENLIQGGSGGEGEGEGGGEGGSGAGAGAGTGEDRDGNGQEDGDQIQSIARKCCFALFSFTSLAKNKAK